MNSIDWIAKRRELLDAVTEGPWRASLLDGVRYEDGSSSYRCGIYPGATQGPPPVFVTNGIDARDAAFIADARTSLPLALKALEAVLTRAQAFVDEYSHPVYSGNGYAEGIVAASHEIIDAIEAALRDDS